MNKKNIIAIFMIFSLIFGLIPCMSVETELGILPENLMIESLTSSPNSNKIFFVAGNMSGNSIFTGDISRLLTGASYNKIADLPSGFVYYILCFMMSLFTALVFLIDRIYSQRLKGFVSTLILPSAFVLMNYISISCYK